MKALMLSLIGLGVCILLIGLALDRLNYSASTGSGKGAELGFPTPMPTLEAGLEKVPVYPGAQRLGPLPNQPGTIAFEVRDSLSNVLAFYNDAMPKRGWVLNNEWSSFSFDYIWPGSEKNAPSTLHLDLRAYEDDTADGKLTTIHMDLGREPNPNNIPLYPGAQQVEIHDRMVRDPAWGGDVEERLISYLTSATPSEVQAYYNSILPQHGWFLQGEPDSRFPEGMLFEFGLYINGLVNIIAKEEAVGQTRVELRLRGNMLKGWYP